MNKAVLWRPGMKQPCGYLLTREGSQGWQWGSRTAGGEDSQEEAPGQPA